MKKIFITLMICLLCLTVVPSTIFAYFGNFTINSGYTYGDRSTANTKMDTVQTAYVNWNDSNAKKEHYEWFRVINSDGMIRSDETLFTEFQSRFINERNCVKNYYYYLQARRENFWDPLTTVTGTWES